MAMDDFVDEEAWRLAFHEAGHAIAASLCGEQWLYARIDPENQHTYAKRDFHDFYLGLVERDVSENDNPHNDAFMAWAGSYAEARGFHYRGGEWPDDPDEEFDPVDPDDDELAMHVFQVCESDSSSQDRDVFYGYWANPALAPHETEEAWARELEIAWPQVRALAARLLDQRIVWTAAGRQSAFMA